MAGTQAPGPSGWPGMGVLPSIVWDLLNFFTTTANQYGAVARFRTGYERCHLISHPEYIGQIYQADTDRYYKGKYYRLLAPIIGNGLLVSNGELWRNQRQLLQPAFQKKPVLGWLDIITTATATMLDDWEKRPKPRDPVDLADDMLSLVQTIIVQVLFGRAVDYQVTSRMASAVRTISHNLLQQIIQRLFLGDLLIHLTAPINRRFNAAVRTVKDTVMMLLAEHGRHQLSDHESLLWLLSRSPQGVFATSALAEKQVADEVLTLFSAGHETTAQALAWTFFFLASHRDIAERVHAESARVLTDGRPTADQWHRLIYTQQVINESLRLMPPVYMVSRTPANDESIGQYPIPKDSLVVISPYVMHRHPDYWDSPDRFDPDRFAPERATARPRYAFFPFGAGPRICLGQHLAMLEMTVIVAMVMKRFQLTPSLGHHVIPQAALVLRPRYGVKVTVESRS